MSIVHVWLPCAAVVWGPAAIMRFFELGISFRTQPGSLAPGQPYPVPYLRRTRQPRRGA
jgi:hypothetical protein